MSGHTPGPWIQRAGHPTDVEAPETGHVASCETAEDARLIAAALDMLEELQAMLPTLRANATQEARSNLAPTGMAPLTVQRDRLARIEGLIARIEAA